MHEEWRIIPFAPDYAVSDHGRVQRITACSGSRAGRLLTPQRRGRFGQYAGVDLRINGVKTAFYIHRLVALTFLGSPPSERHEVAHGDGRPHNNHVSNLRWALPAENSADKHQHGTALIGERANGRKLTEGEVREIRAALGSNVVLARRYGISSSQVQRIRAREDWAWLDQAQEQAA